MQCLPLAENGFEVQFVAPGLVGGYIKGITFISLPRARNRLLRMLSTPLLFIKALHRRAEVFHFQNPELIPIALVAKWLFRKKIVYDAYEDFPSMARNSAWIPVFLRSSIAKVVSWLENLAALVFDGVMTADPFTLRRMARTGKSRKLVFFNFPNLNFFSSPIAPVKRFEFVYRGGLSERTGTMLLLDAMHILAVQGKPARLLLIGYSDNRITFTRLQERIRVLGLEPLVEIRGRIPHESMARALSEASIGVSPLLANPKFLLNIPVKIFEYWACGLPVVASDLPPIRPFFRDHEYGLLFKTGDAQALSEALAWVLDHPEEAARMGERGRRAVIERFNNRNEIRKLRSFLKRIAT